MQTQIQNPSASGFQPLPTRIRDLPPLVVDRQDGLAAAAPPPTDATRVAVMGSLEQLTARLADIHRTAAEAYLSQSCHAEAQRHLEAAASFAPDRLEYHNQLGNLRYLNGDDDGALRAFEHVVSADPRQPEAWFNIGMVRFGRGDVAGAEAAFRRSLEIDPREAEAWNNHGVCLFRLGKRADARLCFERALQLEPANADARANLADC